MDIQYLLEFPIEKLKLRLLISELAVDGMSITFEIAFGFGGSVANQTDTTFLMNIHSNSPAATEPIPNLVRCLLGADIQAATLLLLHKMGKMLVSHTCWRSLGIF
ncbi:hypothetical protein N7516_010088 [Penicillium verrucosum]|uniref:uncharacterized protein n=1 Tax=Penicillium verrucosum TaxID=60171 RepID=UPI0025458471|nr:uncharacterized protein N7516_010088 [Penicillium verrucosum]KAJ5922385.1 hypothetical protein N7516_010088 [Penicillium verrucosum]